MTVKRYDLGTEYRNMIGVPGIVSNVDGRYVRYIDYEALLEQHHRDSAELRRLCAERDKYRAQAAHSELVCDAYLEGISEHKEKIQGLIDFIAAKTHHLPIDDQAVASVLVGTFKQEQS